MRWFDSLKKRFMTKKTPDRQLSNTVVSVQECEAITKEELDTLLSDKTSIIYFDDTVCTPNYVLVKDDHDDIIMMYTCHPKDSSKSILIHRTDINENRLKLITRSLTNAGSNSIII